MIDTQLTPVIKNSFLSYAGAVLQSRALVDVRDCLKPSARQIFYCMETDGFVHSKPFQKTLKSIGSCFRLYIHGDASAEGVIMRAGQPFAMRYPLVEIGGSYGTLLSSQSWSAPRYTEARLSPLSEYLFADLKKDTISEWRDNYDNTEQYPAVLPSKGFYNIVNGSFGIAVGASGSIPQYNLRELNNALIYLIDHPDCKFDDIYVAPDFATGATIINGDQVKESHRLGNGAACKIRSTATWDSKDHCFIITEIPFMVYTETICKQLEEIINGEDNPGIERFNDLTGEKPLIKIYLSKKANPDKVLKYLYKNTALESYYGINFTMLADNGRFPKLFTWKEALQAHIDHEKEVYKRGFLFDLKKIEKRIHIIDALLICLAHVDEVTQTIKTSSSTAAASIALQQKFILDEEQAKAVLDMKLGRLAHLEVQKLEQEREELTNEANKIHTILNSTELFNEQLKNGWREVAKKYGDERRTKIMQLQTNNDDEPIEVKQLQIMVTNRNNVVATETSTLYVAKRGGVGSKLKLEQGEYVIDALTASNTDTLMFFTNKGDVYHCNANMITLDTKMSLETIMPIKNDTICAVANRSKQNVKDYAIFVTKNGYIKKSYLSEYESNRNVGIRAISLNDGDSIVSVIIANNDNLGILTEMGNFVIIGTEDVRITGRATLGVHGIKLNDGDAVIAARPVNKATKFIASISGNGLFKKTSFKEFVVQGKNTKGNKLQKINEGDWMADFIPLMDEAEISIIATRSSIKLKTSDIPEFNKGALGNKSIKLSNLDSVIKFTLF